MENDRLRHHLNEHLVQVKDTTKEIKPKRCYVDIQQDRCNVLIQRNQDQERPNGRKDKVLEVKLRQKSLTNFLQHQDVDSSKRWITRLLGDVVNVNAPVDACANNMNTHVSQNFIGEGSKLACNLRSNLEEGQIGSNNEYEIGHKDSCCIVVGEKNRKRPSKLERRPKNVCGKNNTK